MLKNIDNVLKDIKRYYTNKINIYGPTPQGVDWKDEKSQIIRFTKLMLVVSNPEEHFRINDIGCGYGKLYEYMNDKGYNFIYCGYDLSKIMIQYAHRLYRYKENCSFKYIKTLDEIENADFSVASGIFNVKMSYNESDWLYYIMNTIDLLNDKSIKGFSFNMLTKYSDKEYMRNDLFYADPCFMFDYCKRNYSRNVSLHHDYDLYEFTIIVRK